MKACYLCGSSDHAFCGFCSRCREHTTFSSPEMDPDDPPISECCGALGDAYDVGEDA